jgi:hypothetical protein
MNADFPGQYHWEVQHRGEVAVYTGQLRKFLGIPTSELTELTFFVRGRIHVAHAMTVLDQVRLLEEAQRMRGFNGAYQLVNGPINPALGARYQPNRIHPAWNGRVGDADIGIRRAIFIDIDPVRPKGISATHEEKLAAYEVYTQVADFLFDVLKDETVLGRGDSGNGFFILIAIEPTPVAAESTERIRRFLKLLANLFDTKRVRIDTSVGNVARLMPAPGTWKRKGENTPDRPHRRTAFKCLDVVSRVPLEKVVGHSR